jgi:hypothetical protein
MFTLDFEPEHMLTKNLIRVRVASEVEGYIKIAPESKSILLLLSSEEARFDFGYERALKTALVQCIHALTSLEMGIFGVILLVIG